jgi:hypothetical protein
LFLFSAGPSSAVSQQQQKHRKEENQLILYEIISPRRARSSFPSLATFSKQREREKEKERERAVIVVNPQDGHRNFCHSQSDFLLLSRGRKKKNIFFLSHHNIPFDCCRVVSETSWLALALNCWARLSALYSCCIVPADA